MANNFYDTVKKQNTSAGTSGTGRSALSQALSIMNARSTASQPQQTQPAQINNVTNQQPQSSVISYNSGIRGTADYAKRNNTAFQQQYQLAKSAGVSKEQFYQDYSNGIRWLDQANNAGTGIRQYDSGVAGTREYAKAHMDEFQSQYQLAKQAGLTKDDFYREYSRGQRWTTELEEKPTNLDVANGTAKTLAEDEDYSRDLRAKIHTGLFDNDAIETRRLERLRKKYGTAVFDDNFAGQFKANFGMARIQEEYFQAVADYLDNPTEGNRQYRDDLKALLADFQMRNAEALDDQNVQAGWLSKNMASYFPQLWNQTKATIIPGAIGLAGTLLVGGADKGAFVKAGVTVGSGIYSYNSMRGAAFENLVDIGLDENVARSAANDEAVVSSIIEMADTAVDLFTMIPGLGSAAKEAAKDAAVKSMSKTLLKKVADYGFNIGEEYGEEFVQELLSMANQRRCLNGNADSGIKGLLAEALELAGEMLGGGAKDELAQAHEAGKGGAIIGAFMGGIHMGTGYVTTAISNNQIRNQLSNVNENNLGGYDDQNLQKLLNAAVNPATKNEQAAEYIRSEMDRRAAYDNEHANVDVGGILKTVDPKASEKAQQKVTEDNRKTLDNLTREDITPDKVDEQQLSKLFRECQIFGSRKGYLVIANEINARLTENIKSAFQARQEQETAQPQLAEVEANVAEPIAQTEAPASPVTEEEAAAPAAAEAEPVLANEPVAQEAVNAPVSAEQSLAPVNTAGSKYTAEQLRGLSEETLRRLRTGMMFRGETATVEAIDEELARREETRNKYRKRGEEAANAYSEFDSENDDDLNAAFMPVEAQNETTTETEPDQEVPNKRNLHLAEAIKDALRRQKHFGKDMDSLKQNLSEPNRKRRFYKNNYTPGNVQIFNGTENNPGIYQTLQDAIENTKPDFDYTDEDGVRTYGYLLVYAETNGYTIELQDAIFYDVPTVSGRTKTVSGGMQVVVNGPNGLVFSSEDNSVMTRKSKPKSGAVYFNPATDSAETLVDKVEDAKYTESYASVEDVAHLIADKIAAKDFPQYREDAQRAAAQTRRNEYSKDVDNDTVFGERTDRNNTNGEAYDLAEEDEFDPEADFTNLSEEREQLLVQTKIGPVVVERGTYASRSNPGYEAEYENYWGSTRENVPAANTTATVNRDAKVSDERRRQIAAEREAAEIERLRTLSSMKGDIAGINSNKELGTEIDVDGRTVYVAENEDGTQTQRTILDEGDGTEDKPPVILSVYGGKGVLQDTAVHPWFKQFKEFFSKLLVRDVVATDGAFSLDSYEDGQLNPLLKDLHGVQDSLSQKGESNIAADVNERGGYTHEVTHHFQILAEITNKEMARDLVDDLLLDSNIVKEDLYNAGWKAIESKYREEIEAEVSARLNAFIEADPSRAAAMTKAQMLKVINNIRRDTSEIIIHREMLANIAGGCGVYGVTFHDATQALVSDPKFKQLLTLAAQAAGASYNDINILFSWYNLMAKSADGLRGPALNGAVNQLYEIISQRNAGRSKNGGQSNTSARTNETTNGAAGGSSGRDRGRFEVPLFAGSGRNDGRVGEQSVVDGSALGETGVQKWTNPQRNYLRSGGSQQDQRLTDPQKNARTLSDYEKSLERETPIHTDEDYRETYGRTGYEEMEQKQPRLTKDDMIPRDVTAEERAAAAAEDYEQREQRAYEARQESRKRARIEHGRNAAGIFAASTNIRNQKMSFDTDIENINTKTEEGRRQKRLIDAFDKIRTAAGQVADGTLSPGDFAEFYLNLQDDTNAAQFTMKHVAEAMRDLRQKYLAVLDNGNQHNADSYTAAAEKAMTMAEHSFRQINDAFTMQEQVAALIRQNGKGGAKSKNALVNLGRSLKNFYTRMQISPENMFRGMIGGWDQASRNLGYQISEDITKANIANQHVIAGSQMAYVPIRKMDGIEAFTSGKDKATVTTEHGFSATLSQAELAHLYKAIKTLEATQKRFGDRLETLNGFAFGDSDNPTFYDIQKDIENANKAIRDENKIAENEAKKTGKKPELKKEIDAAQYLREVREAIAAQLPEVAKKYIEISDDVLFDLGKQNSDVEMKVNGVRPMTYGKGDYISLHYANPNDTLSPIEKENIQFGFMNERTRAGGGYVRIVPLTVAMDQYINQSANHIAYSELGRTFELLNRDTSAGGKNIVSLMEEGYGKQFSEWMQNFIEDVQDQNPQERTDGISSILRAGRQAVQTGALVGSVSVPIKQVSSYWAASGKLRLSSLAKAYRPKIIPSKKGQFNQNKQNSLLLYNRKVGGIAPELSEAMKSNGAWAKLKQHSKLLQLVEKAIPMEDYLTVSNVYDACIIEMQEDNPNMDVNSQEFADLVESKFEEVVMETQPIFTKNARPEYARTDNELIKMLSMFRTQQTQNFNRMMRSIGEYRAAKGTANEFLKYSEMSETIKGQAASAMSLSILSIVADIVLHKLRKYRDDDEDDSLAPEKIIERFGLNAIEAASGTLWFGDSALKWAIDKLNESKGKDSNEFYGVNMGIISTVSNVVDSIGWFLDSPTLSNARYVAGYISQTFGIPLNNAFQMLNSATMYASDLLGKNEDHYDDILKMLDKEVIATRSDSDKDRARVLINAYLKGNESKAGRVSAMMDPEKNDAAVRADVQRRYMADKISSEEAQNILLRYTSMDLESVEKRNAFWDFLKEHPQYSDSDKYPGISESFVENYNSLAAPADIPVNKFYEYIRHGNDVKGIDVDGDGDTNGKEDITRKHQLSEYIGSLDISDEQKAALWQSYGYKIDERWDFILEHPDMEGVSKSFVEHYDEFAKPAGIPANNFYEYMQRFNSTKSIDADGDGKTNGKGDITKQSQIIEYINGLNLTKEQKDALWLAFGYKTTSKAYKSRPWK